jgi:hypothetical protein
VLIKSIRRENKFSNLIELFQNFTNEESRQKTKITINFAIQKKLRMNRNERIIKIKKIKKIIQIKRMI